MNIPKIEDAITLLYQTFIEDQDVATQRGIAITAMNEMVRLLGGVDVVAKIESVPYSARLRAQHLFEDEPPQRTEPQIKTTDSFESAKVEDYNRGWNDCLFASGIVKQSPRTWVGLTDEEVNNAIKEKNISPLFTYRMIARAIEAKLKERNG